MSSLKPFKAIIYNHKKVKDVKKAFSPPYDVISPEEQIELHNLSPTNFTHIDLVADKPADDKSDNKYTRAKKTFESWLEKEIMVQDEESSIYFYKQDFKVMGQKYSRVGFIALMELRDKEDSKVLPHENTHAKAVDDRYKLTCALNANLSCIFVCYSDKQRKVEKIFNKEVVRHDPLFNAEDKDHVRHKIWRVSDPALIKEINDSIQGQHLFIADGHHRYQVAMQYRASRLERKTNPATGSEPFNYVMTYFTNLDARDLQIFPMHRVLKNLPRKLDFLEDHFRLDKVKSRSDLLILLAKAGRNEHAFGLYARGGILLLRLKSKLLIDEYVKEGSQEFKGLDATILKHFILDRLGVKSDDIMYTKDLNEAISMVNNNEAQASFIMNPVKISQLKAIALNGERMPPKTTYFYPKVLSGLTVYKMDA